MFVLSLALLCLLAVLPKIMPFTFGEDPVFAGQSIQVTCFVSEGDLPLEIKWEFTSSSSLEDLGIVETPFSKKASVLSIDSLDSRHSGIYYCSAQNRAGKVQSSSRLQVNGNVHVSCILGDQFVLLLTTCLPIQALAVFFVQVPWEPDEIRHCIPSFDLDSFRVHEVFFDLPG